MSDTQRKVPESSVGRSRGTGHTFLIWSILVVMFVAIYSLASPHAPAVSTWLVVATIAAVLALIVWSVLSSLREGRRFVAANNDGIAALARGNLDAAHDVFWHWAERSRVPAASALARHNLAWTQMRRGELQHAVDILLDNEKRHRAAFGRIALAGTSAVDLALCYALLGDLESSNKWLAEVDARKSEAAMPTLPAMIVFARSVLDCRAGRTADAARDLDERWAECEATLTGETVRPLRIVRAFAHAATGPRSAGLAETALAAARPAYPGEYAFLGAAWPEMASFLAAHDLTRPATQS